MSDIIRVLPESVANQIAAGEVIQRPSSVIKELVENAVDAKATDIKIIIKDAGKSLIQVIDNGTGMSETDARMAFERHATSKIKKADDLFALHTMGFRGEALPSICAISEVEIKTRTEGSSIGTRLVIAGSKVVLQEPCVCDKGTVISVRKIFFNVPARRKFLKSDNVELSNIMREFERLALVNNNIRMSIDSGNRQIELRPASLRLRIVDLWRNSLKSDHLIPIEVDTSLVRIEGFVSRPEFARRRNPLQYLIVNGRNMKHPYFHKAVLSCYDNLIASDTLPCYFIRFTVDPDTVDVNIHPTKNEIKFENEQEIWPILVSTIKTALGKFAAVPSIDFSVRPIPIEPISMGDQPKPPTIDVRKDYNPFDSIENSRVDRNWEKLYENFKKDPFSKESSFSKVNLERQALKANLFVGNQEVQEVNPVCLQFADKYIVTKYGDKLLIIDQYRAHVKVLYDEYLGSILKSEVISQSVMFPELVELDDSQEAILIDILEDLRKIGFTLEKNKHNQWKIISLPTLIKNADAKDIILKIIDSLLSDSVNYGNDGIDFSRKLQERMALVMARSAAIRRGQKLSVVEIESIVSRLLSLPDPSFTPNGNPVFASLDEEKIIRML